MRITGRQLRQIIKEEVEKMMNEEDGVPGGIPRAVSDALVDMLQVNLQGARFEGDPGKGVPADSVKFKVKIGTTKQIPLDQTQRMQLQRWGSQNDPNGTYVGGAARSFYVTAGDLAILIMTTGEESGHHGPNEKDIAGDLKDLLTVYKNEILAAVAAGPVSGEITVKPQGIKYNVGMVVMPGYQKGMAGTAKQAPPGGSLGIGREPGTYMVKERKTRR